MTDKKDDKDQADAERAAHSPANEGEGSRSGARQYSEGVQHTIASGQVETKAKDAEKALEGKEGDALRRAEEEGKKHAKGEDPALRKH